MKLLYAARMVRVDMCYSINTLSRYVTRWNKLCDKQISHLFSYLNSHRNSKLNGYFQVADKDLLGIHAYPDADLAGTFDTARATSGGFIELKGLNTQFPLDWFSKRQTATAHSTTEAELIAASKILRENLVPLMGLWSLMLDRVVCGKVFEDNQSTIEVMKVGYSSKMRHLAKHHRISIGVTHDFVSQDDIDVPWCPTDKQKGDILTKGLARPKHEPACELIGLYPYVIFCPEDAFETVENEESDIRITCSILDLSTDYNFTGVC